MKENALKGEAENADVNISPLIDMVFILLIFFIVTTVFVEENGLHLDTPEIVPSKDTNPTEPFVLKISEEGSVFFKGEEIGSYGVKRCIQNAQSMGPLESITLEVHPQASVQIAAMVLGLCSNAQVDKVTMRTRLLEE
ncbi:biopolymer transporter ExbD [Pelagicoccus sp. SDUM812002]|uniref:ExbD/TolR family protein n=1 Tax=Pelagicoccus sp. SDUM812002 TaxID=3041266 RepID=UPI00280F37B5|nr:biopolymer transporter ExbD [Pelagicoccus sp. SDUM812002]MDQ8187510.1 biopolymer transporter ExbD [Pelagicoccus sp. SDUM812002]